MKEHVAPTSKIILWIRRIVLGLATILLVAGVAIAINESRNEVAMTLTGTDQLQIEMHLRGKDDDLNLLPEPSLLHDGVTKLSLPSCKDKSLDVQYKSAGSEGSMSGGFSGSWGNRIRIDIKPRSGGVTVDRSSLRHWYENNRNWIPLRSLLD